ncbi:MAG: hypothetical protein AAF441_25625 [Pseudomonadota bacterium]
MSTVGFEESARGRPLSDLEAPGLDEAKEVYTTDEFEREDGACVECMFRNGFLHLVTVIEKDGFILEIPPRAISLQFLETGLGYMPRTYGP